MNIFLNILLNVLLLLVLLCVFLPVVLQGVAKAFEILSAIKAVEGGEGKGRGRGRSVVVGLGMAERYKVFGASSVAAQKVGARGAASACEHLCQRSERCKSLGKQNCRFLLCVLTFFLQRAQGVQAC